MVKSHFYSLLQIGWREDNFFSITFHALPTIPIALAKKKDFSFGHFPGSFFSWLWFTHGGR